MESEGNQQIMPESEVDKFCDEIFTLYEDIKEESNHTFEDVILKYTLKKHLSVTDAVNFLYTFFKVPLIFRNLAIEFVSLLGVRP